MPRSAPLLVMLVLLVRAVLLLAQDSSTAEQHSQKAFEFIQSGDLKSAEAELRKAIELSPNDPTLLTSLGGILGMEGNLQQANVYLARAVKLNPQDPLLRRNLAANEWQLGRFQQAQGDLELILHANPRDEKAIFLLGMVCENRKDYARSITLLESVPEIVAQQPEALIALASSYYHSNRRDDAQSSLKRLLNRSTKPEVMFIGGRVAMDGRDYALAEALLREAMQAGYANKDSYLLLCKALIYQREYERALQIAKQAAQALPDSYEILATKGAAEMKLQYFTEAVNSLQRAAEVYPSSETKRELALAEWRAGERRQAISEFEETIRQFPRDAETYEVYGALLLEDASPEDKIRAIKLLEQAIEFDHSSVEAHYELANVELESGELRPALEHLEAAIKVDPSDSRLHFAMSRVCRRLGRNADAARELKKYQELKTVEQPVMQAASALGAPH